MGRFSRLVVAAMLLAVSAGPVMACLAPAAPLSEEEKACCREMADQCGSMDMASGHSCCQEIVSTQNDALVQQLGAMDDAAAAAAAIAAQGPLSPSVSQESGESQSDQHPPPVTTPSRAVLRI